MQQLVNDPGTRRTLPLFLCFTTLLIFGLSCVCLSTTRAAETYRVLHIMSYHAPWKWTDDQFSGFRYALQDQKVEYKVFQMDGKRNNRKESLEQAGREAREIIDTWKPDLVYTNDDIAQEYVGTHYINAPTPYVFSGVNGNPITYGFLGSTNITGILEQEHFAETIELLKKIVPDVKNIAVIFDQGATWEGVGGRMLATLPRISNIHVSGWYRVSTFAEYKRLVTGLQTKVDAIALLGIFGYEDEDGEPVPYTDVLHWTAENSALPDFSFWKDRISFGTLCAVSVSGYEQGLAAGMLARSILVDKKPPSSLSMKPSIKGEPVISLARARKLGIKVRADLLLTADIVTDFAWDK